MPPPKNSSISSLPIRAGSSIYRAILPRHGAYAANRKVPRSEDGGIGDEFQPHGNRLPGRRIGDWPRRAIGRQSFLDDVPDSLVSRGYELEYRPEARVAGIVEVLGALERHIQLHALCGSRPYKRLRSRGSRGEGYGLTIDGHLDAQHLRSKLRLHLVVEFRPGSALVSRVGELTGVVQEPDKRILNVHVSTGDGNEMRPLAR